MDIIFFLIKGFLGNKIRVENLANYILTNYMNMAIILYKYYRACYVMLCCVYVKNSHKF